MNKSFGAEFIESAEHSAVGGKMTVVYNIGLGMGVAYDPATGSSATFTDEGGAPIKTRMP